MLCPFFIDMKLDARLRLWKLVRKLEAKSWMLDENLHRFLTAHIAQLSTDVMQFENDDRNTYLRNGKISPPR
jgi:hypothetical protein